MTSTTQQTLAEADEQPFGKAQWRMIITAGTGFFTDAYDLFIIGVVTTILMPLWHLSTMDLAVLNAASLAAAGFGALCFGYLSDKLGRKRMYGFEVMVLFIGAILSSIAPSFIWLLLARIVVGFGIGGDYPSSAAIASESAGRKHRGFLVLLVFAMQAVGLIVGPLVASLMLALHVSPALTWRLLLFFGAIPAASVFYLRRTISEAPRYLVAKKKNYPIEVSRVVSELAGLTEAENNIQFRDQSLWTWQWIKCLIGTAGAWFLLDVAFYGNGVSTVLILNHLYPDASLLRHTLAAAVLFLFFAVPGYFLAAWLVDRMGRKPLQIIGFLMMAITYLILGWAKVATTDLSLFIGIFGLSFFFVNFGPNTTTFLIPSEIYPTTIRARAHGISAATGKLGAFVGVFMVPFLVRYQGVPFTLLLMSLVSLVGIFTTFLVPEMKNKSLNEAEVIEVR